LDGFDVGFDAVRFFAARHATMSAFDRRYYADCRLDLAG
jgi:hypothetical protein